MNHESPWWLTESLTPSSEGLVFSGHLVSDLARRYGTPLYIYSAAQVRRNLADLRAALSATSAPFRMHYAVKANRFGPLLSVIRAEGDCGIDVSSPREALLAREAGFQTPEISATMSMPSAWDFAAFADLGLHLNLDTQSAMRRWAHTPNATKNIGIRLDPAAVIGYGANPKMSYANSKFGIAFEEALETIHYAESLGLTVDTLHFHAGWGLQSNIAEQFAAILERVADLARKVKSVRTINVGGGLSLKHCAEDAPLSLSTWSMLLKKHIAPLGVTIACESGTHIVASAGILVMEVNTVESRRSESWIGVNAGHNVNVYAAHYGIPQALLATKAPEDQSHQYVVAGNINESNDIFSRQAMLAEISEGDFLALFPAGAYGAAMASDHCLKGLPKEILV